LTYVEQLAEINTAITRILAVGHQIGRDGAYVQQAQIQYLFAERKRLEPLATAEAANINTPVVRHGLPVRSR